MRFFEQKLRFCSVLELLRKECQAFCTSVTLNGFLFGFLSDGKSHIIALKSRFRAPVLCLIAYCKDCRMRSIPRLCCQIRQHRCFRFGSAFDCQMRSRGKTIRQMAEAHPMSNADHFFVFLFGSVVLFIFSWGLSTNTRFSAIARVAKQACPSPQEPCADLRTLSGHSLNWIALLREQGATCHMFLYES